MDKASNIPGSGRGRAALAAQFAQLQRQLVEPIGHGPPMAKIGRSAAPLPEPAMIGAGREQVSPPLPSMKTTMAAPLMVGPVPDPPVAKAEGKHTMSDSYTEFLLDKNKRYPMVQRRQGDRGSNGLRVMPVFSNHYEASFTMPPNERDLKVAVYAVHISNDLDELSSVTATRRKPLTRDERLELFWLMAQKDAKAQSVIWNCKHAVAFDGDSLLYVGAAAEALFTGHVPWKFESEVQLYMESRPYPYTVRLEYRDSGAIGPNNLGVAIANNIELPDGRHLDLFPTNLLDAVLRQYPGNPAFRFSSSGAEKIMTSVMLGSSLFSVPGRSLTEAPIEVSQTQHAWFGQYFAPKLTTDYKIVLNIDTTTCVFYKDMSLLEFVCGVLNEEERVAGRYRIEDMCFTTTFGAHQIQALNNCLKGLKVTTMHSGRRQTHTIAKMGDAPGSIEFTQRDGTVTTVLRYFKENKNYQLQYATLQCIICGRGKRTSALPIELCRIAVPQRSKRDLPEDAVSNMIKRLCTVASARKERIERVVANSEVGHDDWTKHFGVSISDKMMSISDAHVIEPPTIVHANAQTAMVRDGAWKADRARFTAGATICAYAVVDLCQLPDHQILEFCSTLIAEARRMGMQVPQQNEKPKCCVRTSLMNLRLTIQRDVVDKFKENRFQSHEYLVFFIFDRRNAYGYSVIKSMSDKEKGFKSQCLLKKNIIPQLRPMTAQNITLKMNVKLGGSNWTLRTPQLKDIALKTLTEPGTLILGIDVVHSSGPDERRLPSIAAVVGNIDQSLSNWRTSVKFGAIGQESVHYIKDAIKERVEAYHKITGGCPKKMIVYRDGVADSHFDKTLSEELQCLEAAMFELGLKETKITLIICVKRHHARFFVCNAVDACGKAGNVPPGLVVDHGVTHPTNVDFFLVSHYGLQGTSRPTHYYVLHDQNNFSQDTLSRMTYYLCHVYARCTRTVSLPAPVYYADRVADRIKVHFHHKMSPMEGATASESGESVRKQFSMQSQLEESENFKLAEDQRANTMFWM